MTEPPPYTKMPSPAMRMRCRQLVLDAAARYGVPPAYVTAHFRTVRAVQARQEVMMEMLRMGLTRSQLALAFGRDLRRVRKSVIGSPETPTEGRRKVFPDFESHDLFGVPLTACRRP